VWAEILLHAYHAGHSQAGRGAGALGGVVAAPGWTSKHRALEEAVDVAAAGTSMMFFLLGALQALLGLMTLSYAAHAFLVVLIETAAGTDAIVWPDELFQDWCWKLWYLAWLILIWSVPVTLILNRLALPPWLVGLLAI